ncbi:MAG: ATP-binding protein [Ilumatobacteraceae bacterium]
MSAASVWDDVVGQSTAVDQLVAAVADGPVHAYLFQGPPGSTKAEASRAFAASLISAGEDPDQRDARLILRGEHPDVHEVRRTGPAISADQAREIVRVASLAPVESRQKVLILDEFHLLRPEGAAILLKTIEEPPASTIFVILADFVPNDLITISSRCVRIEFRAIATDLVAARLVAEGIGPVEATAAARATHGDLDRARVLATDPGLAERREAFRTAPGGLDGTGHAATTAAATLLELIDASAGPLATRHEAEVAVLDERIKAHGERGSGSKQLEERHKRELRRHRTDELRGGLATMSGAYRDALVAGSVRDPSETSAAVSLINGALEALERNPNERLLLETLLWSLPPLPIGERAAN